jgi:hypothetical protein
MPAPRGRTAPPAGVSDHGHIDDQHMSTMTCWSGAGSGGTQTAGRADGVAAGLGVSSLAVSSLGVSSLAALRLSS